MDERIVRHHAHDVVANLLTLRVVGDHRANQRQLEPRDFFPHQAIGFFGSRSGMTWARPVGQMCAEWGMARVSAKRPRRARLQSVPVEHRTLEAYRGIASDELLDSLQQRARPLRGARILHVNATPHGGGVAELLRGIVPLMRALGIVADWRVISGEHDFFRITKTMHNALQGDPEGLSAKDEETYVRTVERNAVLLDGEYDFVFVHDPQPLALPMFRSETVGRWIWRCHIDTSAPNPEVSEQRGARATRFIPSLPSAWTSS